MLGVGVQKRLRCPRLLSALLCSVSLSSRAHGPFSGAATGPSASLLSGRKKLPLSVLGHDPIDFILLLAVFSSSDFFFHCWILHLEESALFNLMTKWESALCVITKGPTHSPRDGDSTASLVSTPPSGTTGSIFPDKSVEGPTKPESQHSESVFSYCTLSTEELTCCFIFWPSGKVYSD